MLTSSDNTIMNAIEVHNLSKRYWIQHERPMLARELLLRPFRLGRRPQEFWALRDVSFSVKRGETVGIIGENGAGKSTLLKILTGVTQPTSGSASVCGRVGALLELGAGFHPDLTGWENTYLNGAILGMSRREIDHNFQAIADFADIGEFMDSPVRKYSSGMFVRLAFSVAIHLDPEVLVIDEVLAVGDQAFQRRGFERIRCMQRDGRTVLFVSHNMEQIQTLCHRAIWIERGRLRADASPREITERYFRSLGDRIEQEQRVSDSPGHSPASTFAPGVRELQITGVWLSTRAGRKCRVFTVGDEVTVVIGFHAPRGVEKPNFGFAIYRNDGVYITGTNTYLNNYRIPWVAGTGEVHYTVSGLVLNEGIYLVSAAVEDQSGYRFDALDFAYEFHVVRGSIGASQGILHLLGQWQVKSHD